MADPAAEPGLAGAATEPSAERDRRRVGADHGRPVRLRCLGPDVEVDEGRITSAAVVAFTGDDTVLAADLTRGPDLPGGHVRTDDASIEAALRRETWEEVSAHLGPLHRVEVIESDYFGPEDLTYMVIYTARVTEIAEWHGGDPSSRGPVELRTEEFLARYRAGDPGLMRHFVAAAAARVRAVDGSGSVPEQGGEGS